MKNQKKPKLTLSKQSQGVVSKHAAKADVKTDVIKTKIILALTFAQSMHKKHNLTKAPLTEGFFMPFC